jgi:acetyl esterase/lipase
MKTLIILTIFTCCFTKIQAQNDQEIIKNINYAEDGGKQLQLDIYKPTQQKEPNLIVWVHGGAWHSGSKENPPLGLLAYGYALASIDFHASTEKPFPADVHDIKAAIRFLRANAKKYGYKADKIIIWGASSGGHLATLVATTNNNATLEGNLGNYPEISSSVQACLDFYGPTNFLTILNQSTPHGLNVRLPALAILLGKPLEQATDLAKLASPFYQADATDPPIFIAHGEQDNQVPINQSIELLSAYKNLNLKAQIEFVPNAGHTDSIYYKKEMMEKVIKFLKEIGM